MTDATKKTTATWIDRALRIVVILMGLALAGQVGYVVGWNAHDRDMRTQALEFFPNWKTIPHDPDYPATITTITSRPAK